MNRPLQKKEQTDAKVTRPTGQPDPTSMAAGGSAPQWLMQQDQALTVPGDNDAALSMAALKLLRRRAEDSRRPPTALSPKLLKEMTPQDAQLLFHELRVYQAELELQNEELRRTQLELEAARERYFDLYDLAPVGYCTVNVQGLIVEANLKAASMLGVARSALVKRPIIRFMAQEHRPIYQQCCDQAVQSGQTQICELNMFQDDGARIWVSMAVNAVRGPPSEITLRVMLRDTSQRKYLEGLLLEKNKELECSRAVADKANRAKSEFLANMSHELRSPLNAILGFAQLMDAGKPQPTPAQKSAIDQILHGGWYLLDLVNEILDLAAIESGQIALSMASESLGDVLQDCQTMIESQAAARAITMSFPSFEKTCLVQADRRRLKQVVVNLLSNAIKYNRPNGTVRVTIAPRPQQQVRISVQDDGTGLTPEQLAQLFQPFNRLGQETGPQEGTGIGLVVSKRLVEMMGGSIGATSTRGSGSVFWFELALAGLKP